MFVVLINACMTILGRLLGFLLFMYLAWWLIRSLCRLDREPGVRGLKRIPILRSIIWLVEGLLSLFGYQPEVVVEL